MKKITDYIDKGIDYSDNPVLKAFNKEIKKGGDFKTNLSAFLNCLIKTSSKEDKEIMLEVLNDFYKFYKI